LRILKLLFCTTERFEEGEDFMKLVMNFTRAEEMNSGCWSMKLRVEGGGGGGGRPV
jgi:hypothetical protein